MHEELTGVEQAKHFAEKIKGLKPAARRQIVKAFTEFVNNDIEQERLEYIRKLEEYNEEND